MRKIFITVLGMAALVTIIGGDAKVSQARRQEEEVYRNIELFIDAMQIVQNQYIEPVENKELVYGALKGMLNSLDPYSSFLEPELTQELHIETKGEFHGVGMEISLKDDIITVVSPIEESPAWNAGIKTGDKIIEIDGVSTKGYSTLEAAQKLRGKKGTQVTVSILRTGQSELKTITLTRDIIKVKSIKEEVLEDNLGYVRVRDFQERSAADLEKILKEFNRKNIEGLVFDLRNNPGGLLTSAIDISELFLPRGKLIVYTQGRDGSDKSTFNSKRQQVWNKPVVILMNQGSASASEIVVGALKDNMEGIKSLGTRTFGKGSVQNLIPLRDGSSLKLTIAHYYTPSGICIEGKGIEPDIFVELPEDTLIVPGDSEDLQYHRALETLKEILGKE